MKIGLKDKPKITIDFYEGNEVFYTIDGSDPTTNGIKYEGGIPLSKNKITLKTAIKVGDSFSEVIEKKYTKKRANRTFTATVSKAKKGSKLLKGKLMCTIKNFSPKKRIKIFIKTPNGKKQKYTVNTNKINWTLNLKKKIVKGDTIYITSHAKEKFVIFNRRNENESDNILVTEQIPKWKNITKKVK